MAAPSVVVVGTGFGARVHVPALRVAGFDVVALVGTDPDRTARRAARVGVPRASIDLEAVLDDVDAVTIATPPATHRALVLAALAGGRHVLCEKPFALSTSDALEMAAAAQRAGVAAVVGHEFRFASDRAVVGRAIESGAIGASGSHLVDQVRVWLGEFASVSATRGASRRAPGRTTRSRSALDYRTTAMSCSNRARRPGARPAVSPASSESEAASASRTDVRGSRTPTERGS